MKQFLLLLFACTIAYMATAQETLTYTQTKVVKNGVEMEGSYDQLQLVFNGNQLKNSQNQFFTYFFDHEEKGWSIYYQAYWNSVQWIVDKNCWYAVSPDRQTINHKSSIVYTDGSTVIYVYKQGVKHKSIGPMYE